VEPQHVPKTTQNNKFYHRVPELPSMRCFLPVFAAEAARSLRSNVVDSNIGADGAGELWIPIPEGNSVYFFNPVTGEATWTPKHTAAAAMQVPVVNHTGQLVPDHQRLSCVPHCAWKCTEPVCEQNCHPECGVPACETRCPKLGAGGAAALGGCKVKCGEPNCAMFCPPDPCDGKKTLDCATPKCTTKCEKPKCMLDCPPAALGCQTVCPTPQCQWHCSKPTTCPKPKCSMRCEMAPTCAGGNALSVPPPPLAPGEEVVTRRSARRGENHWEAGDWSRCATQCGAGSRTRAVECSAGREGYCTGPKPASTQPCEDYAGCRYEVGAWGACSARCGPGTRERSVQCSGARCLGDRPEDREACTGHAETCTECRVTMWGGKGFDGWEHVFEAGEYSSTELEYRGLKCDDISSMEVVGDYCHVKVFEYGDFNTIHPGWNATFPMGKYTAGDLESRGAKNNDISAFKIWRDTPAHERKHKETRREFDGGDSHAGENSNPWRDPFRSSAAAAGTLAAVSSWVLLW